MQNSGRTTTGSLLTGTTGRLLSKTGEGSTARLLQLCIAYFSAYVVFGVATKAFTWSSDMPHKFALPQSLAAFQMNDVNYLVWTTLGGTLICLAVVFAAGWYRTASDSFLQVGPVRIPREYAYIIPSGLMTAVIIPTTTLMYMFCPSVMVAMVIMRASVIVISRIVDEIQIRQGLLHKTVYWQENVAVLFAVAAASVQLFLATSSDYGFFGNPAAVITLGSYVGSYAIRIYIMNYYKNTRKPGKTLNNKWYFSIEQISASAALFLATAVLFYWHTSSVAVVKFQAAIAHPVQAWFPATMAGAVFGLVAFFSVFIFMFKGRTATFAGLVNRLTSLMAGTASTLIFFLLFHVGFPSLSDWISLALILVAVGFLTMAERRRVVELLKAREIEEDVPSPQPAVAGASAGR